MKNRLNWWRHELHINKQTEFAEMLEVGQSQLNRWERQEVQPNLEKAKQLADRMTEILGRKIYIEDLFEWE